VGRAGLNALLRPAATADLDAVAEIFAWYVKNTVTTFEEIPRAAGDWEEISALLDGLGLPFLVAEVDGAIAGYAYASSWRRKPAYRHTVEDSIYVRADLLGSGLGKMLMPALISATQACGMRQMIAVIGDSANEPSIHLHRRFGFQDAGLLKDVGFKFGRWLDTVFMQRSLV